MSIERLPGDAQFTAEITDPGFRLGDRRRISRSLATVIFTPAAPAPARPGGGEAGPGPLGDQVALELGEGGEMPNTSFPDAVVVLTAPPWPASTLNPMPWTVRS